MENVFKHIYIKTTYNVYFFIEKSKQILFSLDLYKMEVSFIEKSKQIVSGFIFSKEQYSVYVNDVEQANKKKDQGMKMATLDYRRLNRFDVNSDKKLVSKGDDKRIFLSIDECFGIIKKAHSDCEHGGKVKTITEIKKTKYHVADQLILLYLKLCKCPTKTTFVKEMPIEINLMWEARLKCHIELVLLEGNKYFLTYQDLITKYLILKPLKSNSIEQITLALMEIMCLFGAPNVVESQNGVIKNICTSLEANWPRLKICYSLITTQLYQEHIIVKNMVCRWMEFTKNEDWSTTGLQLVQNFRNRTIDMVLLETPYFLVFGRQMQHPVEEISGTFNYISQQNLIPEVGSLQVVLCYGPKHKI